MSEKPVIPTLAPRQRRPGVAASLSSANRVAATEAPSVANQPATIPPAVEVPEPASSKTATKRKPKAKPVEAPVHRRAQGKVQIAVDVPEVLRGRARTAFKYASFHGEVSSFSEFVAEAIEDKVRKTERDYNDGREFGADEGNLRSGRPTGS